MSKESRCVKWSEWRIRQVKRSRYSAAVPEKLKQQKGTTNSGMDKTQNTTQKSWIRRGWKILLQIEKAAVVTWRANRVAKKPMDKKRYNDNNTHIKVVKDNADCTVWKTSYSHTITKMENSMHTSEWIWKFPLSACSKDEGFVHCIFGKNRQLSMRE